MVDERLLEQEGLPPVVRLVDEAAELRTRRARLFLAVHRRARADVLRLSEEGARRLVVRINEFRREITDRMRDLRVAAPGAPFELRLAPQIEAEVQAALTTMISGAAGDVRTQLLAAFEAGVALVPEAFGAAGFGTSIGQGVSPALLATLDAAAADLMTETFAPLADRISRAVRLSIAGLDSSAATIERVAEILRTSREVRAGLRRRVGLGFQAEAIARTEIGRAYSAAQQAAAERAGDIIPGLRKRWITRAGIRGEHLAVEAETRENPIPVKQRFRVTDLSRTGFTDFLTTRTGFGAQRVYRVRPDERPVARRGQAREDRLLFPRDPAGRPGSVINCTCTVLEIPPGLKDEIDKEIRRTGFRRI